MGRRTSYRMGLVAVLVALPGLVPESASGQYFGRNKVQYEDFDFRIMRTDRFDVHYYAGEAEAAEDAARMAERWYERLSIAFQHAFQETKPIVLYANHADFQQTNTTGGFINESTGGFTESLKNRVVMPMGPSYWDTDHVMGHEMVHAFQYDIAQSRGGPGLAALNRVPGWMVEGLAEFLSVGRLDPNTAMWMRDAVLHEEFPTIQQLTTESRFFPYRYGQALWAYVAGRYGDRAVPALYSYATRQGWEAAVRRVLGITSDTLSANWAEATRAAYLPVIAERTIPSEVGRVVLSEAVNDGGMQNVAPSLSPDGRYYVFLSERDLFSIDLYLGDARTGKVIRQLTSSATSAHFDALSFMNSSGSFSPDGEHIATVVFEEGDQRIKILRTSDGDIVRTVSTPGIEAIADPAWSPDGRYIAFAGSKGAIYELYVADLETNEVRQLTEGKEVELQPAWSPDGSELAYVTDAGPETNFQMLTYDNMKIAVVDVASGRSRLLPLFEEAKNINPQYGPDGSLYFVSDAEGVSDVYRYDADGGLYRLTHIATGISGITGMSPTMTVALGTGELMFSVREKHAFNINALSPAEQQPVPVQRPTTLAAGGVLPPAEAAGSGLVAEYLVDPSGLPLASTFTLGDYSPDINLDVIAPPTLGVATSTTFGTGVVGGVAAFFSDMLGDHQIGAAIQAQGELKDIGGQAVYQYRENRWNYGAVAGHIPYLLLSRGIQQRPDGFLEVLDFRDRIFIDQVSGLAQYPFSQTRRVDFTAGYTRYGFDREIQTLVVHPVTGQILDRTITDQDAPPALNMFQASAAYVGDTSIFGFVSPIQGGRFRFEVSPTVGTLNFQTLLGDYRRYFYNYPVTFAVRGYHLGRYGGDAEDGALRPLYLGYEWYVRGYSFDSFEADECGSTQCFDELNRLLGSRLAVASAEIRVPFLGFEEFGLINFPYLPTELTAFVDVGLAWGQGDDVSLDFERNLDQRRPVVSTGVSARMNVLGFMILEAYYAYPWQRPDKGWHLGFNIAPGW